MALTKVDGQLIGAPAAVSGAIYAGSLATTPLGGATNPTLGAIETANNYIQAYAYNTANGTFSSADMVVYPNNGTDAAGWVDMGITSNNYSQASYSITGRNEGYLFMSAPPSSGTSGNLVIGTDSTGQYNSVQMYTGGFAQGKTAPKWQLDGATGNMQVAGYASMQNTFGFKNRIINGDMRIDQRNAGANVTATITNVVTYTLDRMFYFATQASKMVIQQNAGSVTPPPGFSKYLGVTSSSAYTLLSTDQFSVAQRIEGNNIVDLAWGTSSAVAATLSFWVRSSLTGTFGLAVNNSTYNRTYTANYTINSANTWEYKTITIPGDTSGTWLTDNNTGIAISFGLGAGSSLSQTPGSWGTSGAITATGSTSIVSTNGATFQITGIQLEKGSQATPFDFRSIGQEVTLCQRYYEKSYNIDVNPNTNTGQGLVDVTGSTNGGGAVSMMVYYKVPKRTTPTVTFITNDGASTGIWNYARSGASGTVVVTAYGGYNSMYVYTNTISLAWGVAECYGHWLSNAEL
jgi:hypothetical protein